MSQLIAYITINRCLIQVHIRLMRLNESPEYISYYSFEIRITSDECLEDIRIKEEWFCCDFKTKIL